MSSDRARLARELHDGIAQDLVAVGYSLDLLLGNPETSASSRSQIRTLRFSVSDLIDKVRREIYFLGQPENLSLEKRVANAAMKECGEMDLMLEINECFKVSDETLVYEIDRIAQEIFHNIATHSKADKVLVSLTTSEESIELRIRDSGVGGAQIKEGHFGLQGLQGRASEIGGELHVDSNESGTEVFLRVSRRNTPNVQF